MAYGFSALNKVTQDRSKSSFKGSKGIVYGRVVDIILDDQHPLFNTYGGWGSIGTIIFQSVALPAPSGVSTVTGTRALPYFSNFKHYPLIGEIVPILFLPSVAIDQSATETISYYLPPSNIWNNTHQNSYPAFVPKPSTQQKSYDQSQAGSSNVSNPIPTILSLGETFVEKPNIHPLQPFEGDIILEGRWGNSIRLGSTVTSKPNTWSNVGKCGDPIIILRAGANPNNTEEAWVPEVENVDEDKSSIYITSTQQIPVKNILTDYRSYTSYHPTLPDQYVGNQIALNSGRLLFNANSDHLVFSSKLTTSFNAGKGFNFDSATNFVVKTKTTIRLGDKGAPHPLIKGDKLVDQLDSLINELSKFVTLFQSIPTPGLEGVKAGASILVPKLQEIKASLPSTKSTKTYTL